MTGAFLSRAASSDATTVDEDVTFCVCEYLFPLCFCGRQEMTYDGGNGKFFFLRIPEQVEYIISDDDALLSA